MAVAGDIEIKIGTKADLASLKQTTNVMKDALNSGVNSDALKGLDKDAINLRKRLISVVEQLDKMESKINSVGNAEIDTEVLTEMKNTVAEAEAEATKLKQQLDELSKTQMSTEQYDKLVEKFSELSAIMEEGNSKYGEFKTALESDSENIENNWEWIKEVPERITVWESSVNGLTYSYKELEAMTEQEREAINLTNNAFGDATSSIDSATATTEIRMTEITKSAEELHRQLVDIDKQLSTYETRQDAIAKLTQKYEDQTEKVDYLKTELEQLSNTDFASNINPDLEPMLQRKDILLDEANLLLQQANEWGAVDDKVLQNVADIRELEAELQRIADKIRTLESQKFEASVDYDDESVANIDARIAALKTQYAEVEAEIQKIQNGTDEETQKVSAWHNVVEGIKRRFAAIPRQIRNAFAESEELAESTEKVSKATKNVTSHGNKLANIFKKISSIASTISSPFKKLGNHIKEISSNAGKTASHLGKSTLKIAKALIGVRGLFALIRKIKSAIKEGVTNLSKASELAEGKTLKDNLDTITAKFTQLKNAIGSAFAPLVNVATPIIAKFVDMITNAANQVAQFMGALTGQKTVAIAKILNKDAVAAENLSKSQSKANNQLAKFDELNNLTSKDDDTSNMFETVEVSNRFSDLVDKLKEMWKLADFTELGRNMGERLKKFLDDIPWAKIQENAEKLGKSLATLINGFLHVDGLAYSVGKTFAEGINTIFHAIYGFIHNLDWKALGSFLANGLNGLFENIDWDLIYNTFVEGAQGLVDLVNNFIRDFHWDNISTTISNVVNTLSATILTFFDGIKWEDLGSNLADQLDKTIQGINWEQLGESLGSIIESAIDFLKGIIEKWNENQTGTKIVHAVFEFFRGVFKKISFESLGRVVGGVLTAMIDIVKKIIDEWKTNNTGSKVKAALHDFFKGVAETVDLGDAAKIIVGSLGAKLLLNLAPTLLKKGIGTAISKLLGNLATTGEGATAMTASGSSIALSLGQAILLFFGGLEIGKKLLGLIFGDNEEAVELINTRWKGISGTFQMVKDGAKGIWEEFKYIKLWSVTGLAPMPRYIEGMSTSFSVLSDALEQVDKGYLYTTDDLNKMRDEMGLSAEDIETIRQAMYDNNEELREFADSNHEFWDLSAGDIKLYRDALELIDEGHISNQAMLDSYLDKVEKGTGREINLNDDLYNKLLEQVDAHKELKESHSDLTTSEQNDINKLNPALDNQAKKIDNVSISISKEGDTFKSTANTTNTSLAGMNKSLDNHTDTVNKSESAVNDLKDTYKDAGTEIDKTAGKSSSWGSDLVQNLINGIRGKLGELRTWAGHIAQTIKSHIHFSKPDEGPLSDFDTYMPDMMQGLADGIKNNMGQITNMMQQLTGNMSNMLKNIDWSKLGSAITSALVGGVKSGFNTMYSIIKDLTGNMSKMISSLDMKKIGNDLMSVFTGSLKSGIQSVSSVMNSLTQSMRNPISNIAGQARSWGMDIMHGLINGIQSMIRNLTNAVSNVANVIWNYLHFSEPEEGPLKNFHTFMPDMIESMVKGIETGIPDVESALSELSSGIAGGVTLPPKVAMEAGKNLAESQPTNSFDFDALSSVLSGVLGSIGNNNNEGDIIIQIDGSEVFRAVRNENDSFIRRTGRSAFAY